MEGDCRREGEKGIKNRGYKGTLEKTMRVRKFTFSPSIEHLAWMKLSEPGQAEAAAARVAARINFIVFYCWINFVLVDPWRRSQNDFSEKSHIPCCSQRDEREI